MPGTDLDVDGDRCSLGGRLLWVGRDSESEGVLEIRVLVTLSKGLRSLVENRLEGEI